LKPDRDLISKFVDALFRHADPGGFISLRMYIDGQNETWRHDLWRHPQITGDGLDHVVDDAFELACAAAAAEVAIVFAPSIATFASDTSAAEKDVRNGLVLAVELDEHPNAGLEYGENLLGPATVVVASGGSWADSETGERQDKLHVHWRLTVPTRDFAGHVRLRELRRRVALLVGGDPTGIPVCHGYRWPGSVHRKDVANPRLARIIELRPDAEIDLDAAYAAVEQALKERGRQQRPGSKGNGFDYPAGGISGFAQASLRDLAAAVDVIENDFGWDTWNELGMALWRATGGSPEGLELFDRLSAKSPLYGVKITPAQKWANLDASPPNRLGAGTVFFRAKQCDPNFEKPSDRDRREQREAELKELEERIRQENEQKGVIGGGIPLMITAKMRQHLLALGYSEEAIRAMTPLKAHQILIAAGITLPPGTKPEDEDDDHHKTGWLGPPSAPGEAPWPEMDSEAFHGLAGNIVEQLAPLTEADPVAILAQLLAAVGNAIGRAVYFWIGNTRHHANLFQVIAGNTAKARKGTAWDLVEDIMREAAEVWGANCIKSGLSSGEGIIHAVHDDVWVSEKVPSAIKGMPPTYRQVLKEESVEDKRLCVIEHEFASVLGVIKRPGNTLSPVIRNGWDGRKLSNMTKNNPETATGAHISIIAHTTIEEYQSLLDRTEMANGFANRFLTVLSRRSKELPFPKRLPQQWTEAFARDLREHVIGNPRLLGGEVEMKFLPETEKLWEALYHDLTAEKPGLFGSIVGRSEPQVVRLSMVYALIDRKIDIEPDHLRAALAFWRYAEASAKFIFGNATGNPLADEIFRALRTASQDGMTRTDIRDMLGRNQSAQHVQAALNLLLRYGMARFRPRSAQGGGKRPAEVWFAV
jgi:hypothetical protein